MAKSKKNNSQNDFKTSSLNLTLNVVIFLLSALIIYMSYSIFIKLSEKEELEYTETQKEFPSEIIQVEVLNGCGVSGVADLYTDFLREKNVDVVNVGNYITFDVDHSLVIDRIGNKANAEKIAKILGIKKDNIITQLNDSYFLDVSIVVGKDYQNLIPLN